MTAALKKISEAWQTDVPNKGISLASLSSQLFVLHSDITKKTGASSGDEFNIDNLMFAGSGVTNGEYIIPCAQPGCFTYLDILLYHYRPAGTETITGAPVLLVHGRVPGGQFPVNGTLVKRHPDPVTYVAAAKVPRLPAVASDLGFNDRAAWWIALGTPTRTIGTPEITPSTTIVQSGGGLTGAANYGLTDFYSIPVLGCTDIVVTIKTAGTVSGGTCMVMGRFSTP